jgi:outer membrane protein assembly factor BamB
MGALRSHSVSSPRVGTSAIILSIIVAACGTTSSRQSVTPIAEPSASVASSHPTPAPLSAPASPTVSPAVTPTIGTIVPEAVFMPDGGVGSIQVTDDAVWVFDLTGVLRIDPATNTSTHLPLTLEGGGISVNGAIGFDSIWVSDFSLGQVRRYDPTTGELKATVETRTPEGVLVTEDGVWVANHRYGTVSRIDPGSDQIAAQVEVGPEGGSGPSGLIEAGGDVWVGIPKITALAGVDPDTDAPIGEIGLSYPSGPCGGMSTYGSRIYIGGCPGQNGMEVMDFRKLENAGRVSLDGSPTAPVIIDDRLWFGVALDAGGCLMNMDPEALATSPGPAVTGGVPTNIAIGFDSVWVAVEWDGAAWLLRLPANSLSD